MKREFLTKQQVPLRELPLGEYFMLNDPNNCEQADERKVYVRGEYDRTSRKYSVYKYVNVNAERFIDGNRLVWVGFYF